MLALRTKQFRQPRKAQQRSGGTFILIADQQMDGSPDSGYPVFMNRTASALLHVGFVLTGVVTTLLGPMLPWLIARWALNDAQAGNLFTAQFVGSMTGVALSGIAVRRLGFRSALVLGYSVLALGVGLFAASVWPSALAPVFTYGIGLGITIPATNLCVSDANPQRRASALNLLNLAWGLGAVLCPALISILHRHLGETFLFPLLAVTLVLLTLTLAIPRTFSRSNVPGTSNAPAIKLEQCPPLNIPALIALAPLFFLYVGTESSLSGWIAAYARRLGNTSGSAWLLASSLFWAALLVGRAAAPLALRRFSDFKVAIIGLTVAAFGTLILINAAAVPGILLAVTFCGLGLASVYPITIALMSHCFGQSASRVAPYLFALASMGGATLPWVVGHLSTRLGSLRSGLLLPLFTTILMLGLYIVAARSRFSKPASDDFQTRATHA